MTQPIPELIRITEVETLTDSGKTTIYNKIAEGNFPPPKKYGTASKWWKSQVHFFILFQRWDETEWEEWVSSQSKAA